MTQIHANGQHQTIDGVDKVYYDGYWIKYYAPPDDTLAAKKQLIQALTRRLFNHVEHGINIPGRRLEEARTAYERETDPARKRVNRAMLAGAYFNRAADIFTKLVELQELGVAINQHNELMRECGQCLLHALDLGKAVRHRNGDESIDELWGEPEVPDVRLPGDFCAQKPGTDFILPAERSPLLLWQSLQARVSSLGATMWVMGQIISVLMKSTLPEKFAPASAIPEAMAFSQLKLLLKESLSAGSLLVFGITRVLFTGS